MPVPSLTSVDIAGFAGLIFSVVIIIAIAASYEPSVFESGLGNWVHGLFIVGIMGSLLFPVVITSHWMLLDNEARICAIIVDIISVTTVVLLSGYYILYVRKKAWLKRNIETIFPPGMKLVDNK